MADDSQYGAFIPTTNIYDIENISQIDINSPEFKNLLVRLRQSVNNMALVTNIKDSGYYVLAEFVNGQLFFKDPALTSQTAKSPTYRQVFRKVINFGALPNATSKSVAHGLDMTSTWTFTRIYGTASDTTALTYISIPFSTGDSAGTGTADLSGVKWSDTTAPVTTAPGTNDFIGIAVDSTNVVITTGSDRTSYTTCYVILEYIKE